MARHTRSEIADIRAARELRRLWTTRALIPAGAAMVLFADAGLRRSWWLGSWVMDVCGVFIFGPLILIALTSGVLVVFKSLLWRCESARRVAVGLTVVWTLVLWHLVVAPFLTLPSGAIFPPELNTTAAGLRFMVMTGSSVVGLWFVFFRPLTRRFLKELGFFTRSKPSPFRRARPDK